MRRILVGLGFVLLLGACGQEIGSSGVGYQPFNLSDGKGSDCIQNGEDLDYNPSTPELFEGLRESQDPDLDSLNTDPNELEKIRKRIHRQANDIYAAR